MELSVNRRMGEQAESPPTGVIVCGEFFVNLIYGVTKWMSKS